MATDPRTIINTNEDPGLVNPTGYIPTQSATNGTNEVKTVIINYTDPPLYGVPELQIFNDPGGKNGAVQFNVGNRLGGDSNFNWNSKTRTLSILGNIRISDNIIGRYNTNTTNLKITGGQDGYMLSTDGTGNISWIPDPSTIYGNSNVANYLPTYTGNVSANYFIGNGSQLTGLPASYSNTNVAAYLPTYTGNVSANYFIGNGSQLTGLPTQYANSNVANYLPTYTGNLNGNSIIITDTGYIYNISSTGLASLTTVNVSSNLTTNAIYTDNYFYANGNVVPIGGSDANTGNVTFNNINVIGTGNLKLQPDSANSESLDIYLTGTNDIHIAGSGNVILGTDEQANVAVLSDGNVAIQAGNVGGTQTWNFDTAGKLTLPRGGIVYETNIPDGGLNGNTIALKPSGGTNADQQLLIYPTVNDANHLHLTSGNLYNTELFLGSDDLYIKLSNTGNIVVNSNDGVGNTAFWTFGTDGTTQFPNTLILAPVSESITMQSDQYSQLMWQNANVTVAPNMSTYSNFYVAQNNAVLDIGYLDGNSNPQFKEWLWGVDGSMTLPAAGRINFDYLSISSDANVSAFYAPAGNVQLAAGIGNAQIVASSLSNSKTWNFDTTGNLTLPGDTFAVNYSNGTQVSLGGSYSNSDVANYLPTYTGNVSANYFIGDGSLLTGLPTATVTQDITSNGAMSIMTYDGNLKYVSYATVEPSSGNIAGGNISTTGNVSANYFIGNGATLTYITGSNVNGNVTSAVQSHYANIANSVAGSNVSGQVSNSLISGTVYTNAQPNITSVGTLTSLTISGNVTANNLGNISIINLDGNSSNVLYGNGVFVAAPSGSSSYGNSNVATFLASFGSNTISTTGNANIGNINAVKTVLTGTSVTGVSSILAGPTFTPLANTTAGFVSNVNSYTQLTIQNKSTGADATTDFVATADNGSDTVNYLDLGIINSGYDNGTPTNSLGNIVFAADSYIYAQGNTSATGQSGGNLAIGTTVASKTVKIFAGGVTSNSIVASFANTGANITGSLNVSGNITGANISGNISITGNIQGTSSNVSLVAGSYTMTFDNTGILTLPRMGGDEGGEINFGIPASNTTLTSRVVVDVFQDRFRIFDGSTKGAYIDLSQATTGVGTLLNNRVSGFVNAGTFVTMDNIKATVTTTGSRGLSLATVSGSFAYNIGGTFGGASVGSGGSGAIGTLTTSATTSIFSWGFNATGDTSTYILTDTTNSRAYRITLQIGASFNNNMISIERLI